MILRENDELLELRIKKKKDKQRDRLISQEHDTVYTF